MTLRRTAKPADLHTICSNQQRDAYAEVIVTCGSLLEDALREAWRFYSGEGPPDDVATVSALIHEQMKTQGSINLAPVGLTKMFFVLKKGGFFDGWSKWRHANHAFLDQPDLLKLLDIRNDLQHRRSQTLGDGDGKAPETVSRKNSRDMAKACLRALVTLGQLDEGAGRSWAEKLGTKPIDPPVNNLPGRWYVRLIGRDEELDSISAALQTGNFSRFALEGRAGVGKSSIAREFAEVAFAQGNVRQVIWVSGKERYYTSKGELIQEGQLQDKCGHTIRIILGAFRWELDPTEEVASVAAELLSGCDAPLLVLDNWESLQGDQQLESWLDDLPASVRILYTSRRGVTQARPIRIGGLSRAASLSLLSDYLRDSRHWNSIINAPGLPGQIHDETDGNPLLLMLLASTILRKDEAIRESVQDFLFARRRGRDLLDFLHDYNIEVLNDRQREAFIVSPLLDQPLRSDHLAAALAVDPTTADQLLRDLVEAGLAQLVFNRSAISPFGRERFRIHNFSLQYARRLLVSHPELQKPVNERMQRFLSEGALLMEEFRDEGHYPIGLESGGGEVDSVILEIARELRGCRQSGDYARFENYVRSLRDEWGNSSWGVMLLHAAATGLPVAASKVGRLKTDARQVVPPLSVYAVNWLVRDAVERHDTTQLTRLVESGADVDLILVHKEAVHLGQTGHFKEARQLLVAGQKRAFASETPVALRQRQYFTIGLGETDLQEARNSQGLSRTDICQLLTGAEGHVARARELRYLNRQILSSLEDRIVAEKRRVGC